MTSTMPTEKLEKELEHMFREDLVVACQYWGVEFGNTPSEESLAKLLAEKMDDRDNRISMFKTFTEKEQDLIGMLTLSGGAMSYDRLKPFRKQYSYGQLNQTERDLRKKGIIIRRMMSRVTDHGREVAEFKVLDFFIPHLTEFFSTKPEPNPEKPKKTRSVVNERDTLLIDMLLLVSYLTKNEVSMTSSWEFPKREQEYVREAMSKQTDDRFELVQKIARKAGAYRIIEEDRVVHGNVKLIFEGKQEEVSTKILLSSLGRTRAIWATPDQPTEYTLNLAICRLREGTTEEWISIEEMKDWIRSELFIEEQPLKWIQVDDDRVRMALETPILLGLVEGAYRGRKLQGVKLTPVGQAVISRLEIEKIEGTDTFFVQPNFEVTVFSSEMDYYQLYQLMLFTEPIKTDVASTLRITDKSIFQAVELDFRETEILEFLERESSKPIPKNVIRSIKDWTSQTTFADLSSVILFETENERDLEDLMLLNGFNKHVVRQIGPTAVIMQGEMEEIGEDLKRYKCHVRQIGKEKRKEEPSTPSGVAEQMMLFSEQIGSETSGDCEGCPAILSCNKAIRKKSKSTRRATY